MPRLTTALSDVIGGDGPQLWIKRDDCTGLATGGNKNRKLEFLLDEALAQVATHIVTQGAVQSNHVRQTAAARAKLGLKCTPCWSIALAPTTPTTTATCCSTL